MVRGKGKRAFVRGGGRHFTNQHIIEENGEKRRRAHREEEDDEDDSEEDSEESEEEESEDEKSEAAPATSSTTAQPELSRTEKRDLKRQQVEAKKQTFEAGDEDLINPNHVQEKMNISDLNTPRELTRREREKKEKDDAKDKYWKLHLQGKTDEAKADLSRLVKIRAERDAAQAKRQVEAGIKAKEAEARKKAQLAKRTT